MGEERIKIVGVEHSHSVEHIILIMLKSLVCGHSNEYGGKHFEIGDNKCRSI